VVTEVRDVGGDSRITSDSTITTPGDSRITPLETQKLETQNINKKTKAKKGAKITLAQWEEKNGAALCVEMLATWCKENDLDLGIVKKAIPAFRERMQSGENLYADFAATFKVWMRNGYLPVKFEQAKRKTNSPDSSVRIVDRGLTL
jgi:hypothetical protein